MLTLSVGWGHAADPEVIDIGSRRELFVDKYVIESMDGAELRLHRPTPRDVVIVQDQPWEGSSSHYMTVFKDGDLYRMYYRGSNVIYTPEGYHDSHREVVCYAESKDGIRWTKPNLGLVSFGGSKKNNIIWDGIGSHCFAPFKDPNPDARPDERYKAISRGRPHVADPDDLGDVALRQVAKKGLYVFKSPDGIRWSLMKDEPVITDGAFDSQNVAFWDSVRGEYRGYHREFRDGRDIMTATSKNFRDWSDPVFLEYSPGRVSQLYTNQIIPYYRAPHIFMGFPTRYVDRGWTASAKALPQLEYRRLRGAKSRREGTAVTDGMFMTSRDALKFNVWPESFIRPGLRLRNNWFYGDNYQNWGIVETKSTIEDAPDELSFYANEASHQGDSNRWRRYTLRIDGFVSVRAPLAGGEFVTKTLRFAGDTLELNFSTSAAGSIRVELQNPDGTPLKGFAMDDCEEIYGDALAREVPWKGGRDLSQWAGKPVRLRFVLKDADLYAIRFK